MNETLTIKETAAYLKMSVSAVRWHLSEWGFFKLPGSRLWRIRKADLDKISKQGNNQRESALFVSNNKRGALCRSTNGMAATTLILQRKLAAELDARLKRA
ncbi:helix-turn-helix domain-containing protein [Aggregatibacter actinomycetemcomitans]|uniref:helix-turn-helix domain-containing protein n=1 Tax=Aggregatibacter actinomycetemcomitans TaxID=714 RepID=UPI0009C13309|nr:helix-turn-helix domain-containing protein [Aggregatibacter actinomycetemcomitans]